MLYGLGLNTKYFSFKLKLFSNIPTLSAVYLIEKKVPTFIKWNLVKK